MRIADRMNLDSVNNTLTKNRSDMSELQNQAALQKRVTKPSDDPLAATRILSTRSDISGGQQYMKSVSEAKAFIEYSEQSLGELSEVFNRAKELALSQANDASADVRTRQVAAAEVEQLHDQTVQVSNRKLGDRFLFSGFKTTAKPFENNGHYSGDDGEIKISIQKEGAVAMNVPGNRVFLGKNIHGLSAAEIKSIQQTEESPEDLDERARIQDDLGGHVRGPASVETSVHSGKIARTAKNQSGTNTDSEMVSNSASKKIDGINVFKVLNDLATGLKANDKEAVQDSIDQIDVAMDQIVQARALMGARVSTLTGAMESLQKSRVDGKTMVSNLEDADTFELVSDINKSEATLKASMAIAGKLIQPSLLDFLK